MAKKIIPFDGDFPLSTAIIVGNTMEVSGQIGINPQTQLLEKGAAAQTRRALTIIKNILEKEGWQMTDIVKVRVYLINMKDYAAVNEAYKEFFAAPYPTRVVVGVQELPAGAAVEIECVAILDK